MSFEVFFVVLEINVIFAVAYSIFCDFFWGISCYL